MGIIVVVIAVVIVVDVVPTSFAFSLGGADRGYWSATGICR